jgi:hypothetical protein
MTPLAGIASGFAVIGALAACVLVAVDAICAVGLPGRFAVFIQQVGMLVARLLAPGFFRAGLLVPAAVGRACHRERHRIQAGEAAWSDGFGAKFFLKCDDY